MIDFSQNDQSDGQRYWQRHCSNGLYATTSAVEGRRVSLRYSGIQVLEVLPRGITTINTADIIEAPEHLQPSLWRTLSNALHLGGYRLTRRDVVAHKSMITMPYIFGAQLLQAFSESAHEHLKLWAQVGGSEPVSLLITVPDDGGDATVLLA